MAIALEQQGRRIYLTGETYSMKERIKSAGGKWDPDRRAWWLGSGKREQAEAIAAAAPASDGPPALTDQSTLIGKARYKGRTYYVAHESRTGKYRLCTLDLKIDFWAAIGDCQWLKAYEPSRRSYGYGYGGGRREIVSRQTIGSMRRFIAGLRRDDAKIASGQTPAGYCLDHEDGLIKPYHECDMPAGDM